MARRSAGNPRYQRDAKVGSTRRSASSAKPKREAGERGPSGPAPKGRRRIEQITTPEIKRARKRWWFFIVGALGAAGVLLVPAVQSDATYSLLAFSVWGACFLTAMYTEFFTIRKLRKAEIERRRKDAKG